MGRLDAAWAGALLAGAKDEREAGRLEGMLDIITQAMAESGDLRALLLNPVVPGEAKKDLLCAFAPDDAPYARNFLRLLVDKRREALLPEICGTYKRLRDLRTDEIEIVLTSAQALGADEADKLKDAFVARYGAKGARVTQSVDPRLIGGLRAQVGDDLFDQSIAGRLAGLGRALQKEAE